ncbi:hypothetical protein TNCV_4751381 [Trichonephila clavipes]|nr:hypothetical protein TNCV_4751381 [Trichonephila clavipes]
MDPADCARIAVSNIQKSFILNLRCVYRKTSVASSMPTVEGQFLNITKTSRLHMAAYLCIASNGIPPAVSKRIMLNVNFAPMIWIPNQLVGAAIGADVTLDCNLESHPKSVTYWTRDGGGFMILSNTKFNSLLIDTGIYKVQMRLIIKNLRPEDFGSYTCVAKNSLGETEGTIRLYGELSCIADLDF